MTNKHKFEKGDVFFFKYVYDLLLYSYLTFGNFTFTKKCSVSELGANISSSEKCGKIFLLLCVDSLLFQP